MKPYTDGEILYNREVVLNITLKNGLLHVEFITELPEKGSVFSISKEIILDAETCKKLGVKSLTILPVECTIVNLKIEIKPTSYKIAEF